MSVVFGMVLQLSYIFNAHISSTLFNVPAARHPHYKGCSSGAPLYDSLTTNVPHPVMGFHTLLYPPSTPLRPPTADIKQYLRSYAETFQLMQHILLNSAVNKAVWNGSSWLVNVSSSDETFDLDKLIVANGHYHVLCCPDMSGVDDLL